MKSAKAIYQSLPRSAYTLGVKQRAIVALRHLFFLVLALAVAQAAWPQNQAAADLVQRFTAEKVFWKQFDIAKELVASRDRRVLPELEPWLTNADRHIRANVAFVFAGLGDNHGFETLKAILDDFSARPFGQGVPTAPRGSVAAQIVEDRYYAVHVFGELKDPKAGPILVPLLTDKSINYEVAWALGEIGDRSAIPSLIAATADAKAEVRLNAVDALAKLHAHEALRRLHELLNDNDGLMPVSQAAKEATAILQTPSWPSVEAVPVNTRIVTKKIGDEPHALDWYFGECQVRYIANGKPFLVWATLFPPAPDINYMRRRMSSCPRSSFVVRFNSRNPSDAVAMRPSWAKQ